MNHKQLVQQLNQMKAELEALRNQVAAYENVETEIVKNPAEGPTSRRRMLKRLAMGAGAFAAVTAVGATSSLPVVAQTATPPDFGVDANGGDAGYGGKFAGGLGALQLIPGSGSGAPKEANKTYDIGALYVDSQGALYLCVAKGTGAAAKWRMLAGPEAAGGFTALSTPARIIDTRVPLGTVVSSSLGGTPTGKMTGGETRVYQITSDNGPVPTGATAITGAVTSVNIDMSPGQSGYFTFWGTGDRPGVSQVTYNVAGAVNAGTFTANLDPATGRLSIFTFRSANMLIDIAGYYR